MSEQQQPQAIELRPTPRTAPHDIEKGWWSNLRHVLQFRPAGFKVYVDEAGNLTAAAAETDLAITPEALLELEPLNLNKDAG